MEALGFHSSGLLYIYSVLPCVVLCCIVLYCAVWYIVRANLRAPPLLKIERYVKAKLFIIGLVW